MNLNAIIARGPRAIPARINKVTSNEVRRMIIDANDDDIPCGSMKFHLIFQ